LNSFSLLNCFFRASIRWSISVSAHRDLRRSASCASRLNPDQIIEDPAEHAVALVGRHRPSGPSLQHADGSLEFAAAHRLVVDACEDIGQLRRHGLDSARRAAGRRWRLGRGGREASTEVDVTGCCQPANQGSCLPWAWQGERGRRPPSEPAWTASWPAGRRLLAGGCRTNHDKNEQELLSQ